MLNVNGLTKTFGSGSNKLQVLKGVDMSIETGEMVALMGPSGSGKSTLLNIIGGLLAGDGGSITLGDRTYGQKNPSNVVDIRREYVGWIFQDFHLVERLTALDNVIFSLELSGVSTADAETRARNALERVGLGDRMNFIPDQLSGGQQQRVAVARAISGSRSLILADEPTGNLDVKSAQEIIHLFQDLCRDDGISILMVTHDPLQASMADRMLLLKDGTTAASDIRSAWGIEEVN
jgi:putative ABC transport system ATP-binding protein